MPNRHRRATVPASTPNAHRNAHRSDRRATTSRAGWQELAHLVLAALGSPVPALAGAAVMQTEAQAARPAAHAGPAPARPRPGNAEPAVTIEVEEGHQETWKLVEAAQGGDGEAFGQLYDRYFDSVYRFIYYRVNDRALAEDFTSETFLRALRRISSITYQGRDIGAWLMTIARNIIFDHSKSARNRLEVTTAEFFESNELVPGPDSAVLNALTLDVLVSGIKQLNDDQRECVVLRFIQGLSVSETAAAMGKNDGAIKALQHRAVRKLADLVGDQLR